MDHHHREIRVSGYYFPVNTGIFRFLCNQSSKRRYSTHWLKEKEGSNKKLKLKAFRNDDADRKELGK